MIDIETLGNSSGSVICSVAAVEFDLNSGETGRWFYERVQIQSCIDLGLKIDASTIAWWLEQNDVARKEMLGGTKSIKLVLYSLINFISGLNPDRLQVWGNGSRFDLGLLEDAFKACCLTTPWKYYNERDVRTLASFKPELKKGVVNSWEGLKHSALDDCYMQITYCSLIWNALKEPVLQWSATN